MILPVVSALQKLKLPFKLWGQCFFYRQVFHGQTSCSSFAHSSSFYFFNKNIVSFSFFIVEHVTFLQFDQKFIICLLNIKYQIGYSPLTLRIFLHLSILQPFLFWQVNLIRITLEVYCSVHHHDHHHHHHHFYDFCLH